MGEREEEGNGEGGINVFLYSPSTYSAAPANQIISLLFSDGLFINIVGFHRGAKKRAHEGVLRRGTDCG